MESAHNTWQLSKQSIYFYRITVHPKKITVNFLEIFMMPYVSLVCITEKKPSRNIFQIYNSKTNFMPVHTSFILSKHFFSFDLTWSGYFRNCCDLILQLGYIASAWQPENPNQETISELGDSLHIGDFPVLIRRVSYIEHTDYFHFTQITDKN